MLNPALIPQLLSAAEMDPGGYFVGRETEWDRPEEIEGCCLFLPIVFGGVVHIGDAARYRIEYLEGSDELSRGEDLYFKATAGDPRDGARQSFGAGGETR
jgi:hypothetical protein